MQLGPPGARLVRGRAEIPSDEDPDQDDHHHFPDRRILKDPQRLHDGKCHLLRLRIERRLVPLKPELEGLQVQLPPVRPAAESGMEERLPPVTPCRDRS